MTCHRGPQGNLSRFNVSNLTNQNNVRVLAQPRPQYTRKVEPNRWIDLHLIDASQLIFNRVFNRDDFLTGLV